MNTPKLRVIQSNSNGFVSQLGDLCYSGLKSFSNENPRESRLTLFILKNEDGTKNVSVFESVFSGEKNTEGQYIFVTVTTPVTVRNVNTNVHLMSSLSDKMELVDSVLWVILTGGSISPPILIHITHRLHTNGSHTRTTRNTQQTGTTYHR